MIPGNLLIEVASASVLSKEPSNDVRSIIDLLIVKLYNNLNGQERLFVNEDNDMKAGKLKVEDIDYKNGRACVWGFWSVRALSGEGQRLLKLYPEYIVLKDDWANKTKDDFYASVVYAYMVDCILEENKDNEELMKRYANATDYYEVKNPNNIKEKSYRKINCRFFELYEDYLVEQKHPGIHDRVNAEYRKKIEDGKRHCQELRAQKQADEWMTKIKEQQDLASGKRVVCPYCKSTNTDKISTVSRAVSVSLVGAASSKLGKQWHCNNCNSNF